MKAYRSILWIAILCFIVSLPLCVSADQSYDLSYTMEADASIVYSGEQIEVNVSIDTNQGFRNAVTNVNFDADILTYAGYSAEGSIFPEKVFVRTPTDGQVRVTVGSAEDLKADGVNYDAVGLVVTLKFRVAEHYDGQADLTLDVKSKNVYTTAMDFSYNVGGDVLSLTVIDRETHVHSEKILPAVEPTCTDGGLSEGKTCTVCEEILQPQTEIPPLGHTEEIIPAVDATCKEGGLTLGVKCSACDEILAERKEIPPLGHTEEIIPAVDATCKEGGLTLGVKCSACDEILEERKEIPPLGHSEEVIPAVEATCTQTGLTEGKKCSVCAEILIAQSEVALKEHSYSAEFTVDKEATYGEDGVRSRHCASCADKTDVTVIPKLVDSSKRFSDVSESDWFKSAVDYVVRYGIMNGVSADTFAPNVATDRAMLVTVLYRLEGSPDVSGQDHPFTDVADDTWYTDAMTWAFNNNVVNGVSATLFKPTDDVTREQFATILYRYTKEVKGENVAVDGDLSAYIDAEDVSDYAEDAMLWATANEYIKGVTEDTLKPKDSTTRAQMATILMRYCE